MNTFLPYPDFRKSAECLDRQRLGKQRVECLQLISAIAGITTGWNEHPCANMWRANLESLVQYSLVICETWTDRGYIDTCYSKICEIAKSQGILLYYDFINDSDVEKPWWFGDDRLHSSHRSNLLRKDTTYYGHYGWKEDTGIPYWWPNG